MKQLLIKSIVFLLLFTSVLTFVTDPLFDKDDSFFKKTINEYYETDKDSIDILIFGSSHAINTYNPKVIDKTLGTYTFNLGSAGQKLGTTQYLINEVVDEVKPKVVVLDLFHYTASDYTNDLDKKRQFTVLNNTKPSFQKFKFLFNTYDIDKTISSFSNTIRNHQEWYNYLLPAEDSVNVNQLSEKEPIRGYVPFSNKMKLEERQKFKDFYTKEYKRYDSLLVESLLDKNQIKTIVEINNRLKEKNISFVLVIAPFLEYFYSEKHWKFNAGINKLADSLGIGYIDYNSLYNELDIDFKDFRNKSHLNDYGSNKVSTFLAKHLSTEHDFSIVNNINIDKYLSSIQPRTSSDINEKIKNSDLPEISEVIDKARVLDLNHKLNNELDINKLYLYSDDFNLYIAIDFDQKQQLNAIYNYDIGFLLRANTKDYGLLPSWVRDRGVDRLTWINNPKNASISNKNTIMFTLEKKCEIDIWKELQVYLLKDNKINGNKLRLREISFNTE